MRSMIRKLKKEGFRGEIYFLELEEAPVQFKSNKLYSVSETKKTGYAVRVIKDGALGFSSAYGKNNLEKAVNFAIESARVGVQVDFSFPEPETFKKNLKIYDENLPKLKPSDLIEIGKGAVDDLARLGDVKVDVEMRKVVKRVRIVNTEGLDIAYSRTGWDMGIVLFSIIGESITWIYDAYQGGKFADRSSGMVKYIRKLYRRSKKIAKSINGKKEVIFTPFALHTLLLPIYRGINGENVARGISPLTGKLGKKILSNRISIIENPQKAWGYSSMPVDDEGVATKKKYIIEKGVLRNYALDLRSASKLKLKPTGNGVRTDISQPSPGISNMEIEGGDIPLSEMIKNMKDGLIVYSVLGAGQSNILAGDFSVNASLAFRVRSGEIVGRVKDTMIAGNAYDLLNKVKEISKERKNFMGMLLPAIKFRGVNIAGK